MIEIIPWPAQNIAGWAPVWKMAGCFLGTLVLEDAATAGAGFLLAAGAISWPAALTACFLGIWFGDTGLYLLARFGGRSWFERSRLRSLAGGVARSEKWFARRGTMILIFSRVLPGARLPTYLAAGFLRSDFRRFLLVTGAAAFGWAAALLWLSQTLGAQIHQRPHAGRLAAWLALAALLAAFFVPGLVRRSRAAYDHRRASAWLGRWTRWEFWPAWIFYPPVALHCLWLAVKHRGLSLPMCANPGIFSGGMVGESKMETLRELMATSPRFTAEAELLQGATADERLASLFEICGRRNINFPLVLKPDVGQRGAGVKVIRNERQARDYLRRTGSPVILQRFAEGPGEIGVFYYRFPNEPAGKIFAITEKIFPSITGDGSLSVAELIWSDPRARFLADKYLARFAGRENSVPPRGDTLRLVETGNHAQGCVFLDGARFATAALARRIDEISKKLPGFNIGRYDIRFSNESELLEGGEFQIIELNGAASEATSVYDSRNSLITAYRTLFRQWDLVFAIGAQNRARGVRPAGLRRLWKAWRDYARQRATYPPAD